MNGQFQVLPVSNPESGSGGLSRLVAALLFSCLLHGGLLITLYFLLPAGLSGFGAAGGGRLSALSVKLLADGEGTRLVPDRPEQGEVPKDAPASVVISRAAEMPGDEPQVEPGGAGAVGSTDGALGFPLPVGPYYLTSQLTRRPQALAEVELPPPEILAGGSFGKIIMNLWISASGEVVRVSVDSSELSEPVSEATVEAFRKLRFKPGELNGQAVGVVMKIEAVYADTLLPAR